MNAETSPATPGCDVETRDTLLGTFKFLQRALLDDQQNAPVNQKWSYSLGRIEIALDLLAAAPTPLQAEMQKSDQVHLTRNDGSRATVSEAHARKLEQIADRLQRAYGHLPANQFPGPPGAILDTLREIAAALRASSAPTTKQGD